MSKGAVKRPDHDGRRCAYGEVALKFVVKVNVAREVRMPYHFESISIVPVLGLTGGGRRECIPLRSIRESTDS